MAEQSFDAVVVGAGLAGAATALFLQRDDLCVLLIDAVGPGAGASGANPGFLWLQTKPAGAAMAFALRCRRFAEEYAAELDDDSFRACGGLILWREGAEDAARAFVDDRVRAGLPVALIDRAQTLAMVPQIGPSVQGAVWNPHDAHQDTPQLCNRIVRAFTTAGGTFRTARATRLIGTLSQVMGVELADGTRIESGIVVLAAGPATPALIAPLGLSAPLDLVRFEAARTGPAPFRIGPVLAGQALFRFLAPDDALTSRVPEHPAERDAPGLDVTEQIVSMPDGSITYGCAWAADPGSGEPTPEGARLGRAMAETNLPAIAKLPEQAHWAALVGAPADGLPVIDASPGLDGLALNFGHFFGNLAGGLSGRMLADSICNSEAGKPEFGLARLIGKEADRA